MSSYADERQFQASEAANSLLSELNENQYIQHLTDRQRWAVLNLYLLIKNHAINHNSTLSMAQEPHPSSHSQFKSITSFHRYDTP